MNATHYDSWIDDIESKHDAIIERERAKRKARELFEREYHDWLDSTEVKQQVARLQLRTVENGGEACIGAG